MGPKYEGAFHLCLERRTVGDLELGMVYEPAISGDAMARDDHVRLGTPTALPSQSDDSSTPRFWRRKQPNLGASLLDDRSSK